MSKKLQLDFSSWLDVVADNVHRAYCRTCKKTFDVGNMGVAAVKSHMKSKTHAGISGCCCCLPTPMALASGGSPMFPLVVHQPAYLASSAVTPAGSVHKSRGNNVVRMWVQLKR